MTPAEHYAEAERLLGDVSSRADGWSRLLASHEEPSVATALTGLMAGLTLAEAQVHATLATVDPANLGRRRPPMVAAHSEAP